MTTKISKNKLEQIELSAQLYARSIEQMRADIINELSIKLDLQEETVEALFDENVVEAQTSQLG